MKTKYYFLWALMGLGLVSCATRSIYTNVLVPAEITISQDIQTVGILNRSLPAKGEGWNNFLEGFVTGESIMADREGSYNTCKGLAFKLNANPRFKGLLMDGENYRGTGTKEFPVALDWGIVDQLCQKYNTDAIVTLETFDSDIALVKSQRLVERTIDGVKKNVTEFLAELRIRVNAGWRIYDNINKRIIDQQVFWDEKSWKGVGLTPEEALSKLPSKRSAINDAGFFSGEMMGMRISPNWTRVSRYYYVRGDEKLKQAKAAVKVNDWKRAANFWSPVTNNPDSKVAGRACHNMALASEMEGNLEMALVWAKKAYTEKHFKKIRSYLNELTVRQMDQEKLKEQLPENK